MIRAIVIAALLGQTIYEWTDSKGQTHFTNDPSTIPANAKRKPTEGSDIVVEGQTGTATRPTVNAKVPDAGSPDAGTRVDAGVIDACRSLQAEVNALEGLLRSTQAQGGTADLELAQRCQEMLNTHGSAGMALCRMNNTADPSKRSQAVADVQRELDAKKDALRRAQVSGCR